MKFNLETYTDAEVINYYKNYEDLQKPELTVLRRLEKLLPEMTMLDIGIGGGRTTAHFAPHVKNYIGIDYSEGMVNACKDRFGNRFENAQLKCVDARDLSQFNGIDFVLFSFNGIDSVNVSDRDLVMQQIYRTLNWEGYFFFSTHNINSLNPNVKLHFRFNIISMMRTYFNSKKVRKVNRREFEDIKMKDLVQINDGAHNFGLKQTYVKPLFQFKKLQEYGYQDIRIFSLKSGEEISLSEAEDNTDKWLYFLCRKSKA